MRGVRHHLGLGVAVGGLALALFTGGPTHAGGASLIAPAEVDQPADVRPVAQAETSPTAAVSPVQDQDLPADPEGPEGDPPADLADLADQAADSDVTDPAASADVTGAVASADVTDPLELWAADSPAAEPTGPSVVRRRDPPDHYVRPPDVPYRSFTLAATGDLLIHTPVRNRAAVPGGGFDFAPQLAGAFADVAAADVGVCHLEVPLDPVGPYSSYPLFNAPAELAEGIAATGWDVCSTASNHSADKGFDGLVKTLEAMDAAGVEHRGMFRTEAEYLDPRLLYVGDIPIGLLSATYGLNGLPMPGGNPWAVQLIDVPVLMDRVADLRAAGAEVVVLAMHWGNEYQHTPAAAQRDVATQLMGTGQIDAIIGHHAHVVQPVEWIDDRPVVYGLGNFLSGQRQQVTRRDGAIVTLEFREGSGGWWVDDIHARPTWVDDSWSVVTAHPDQGGVLGESAQRTLGYLGVPLSPPPGAPTPPLSGPPQPPDHYTRPG